MNQFNNGGGRGEGVVPYLGYVQLNGYLLDDTKSCTHGIMDALENV